MPVALFEDLLFEDGALADLLFFLELDVFATLVDLLFTEALVGLLLAVVFVLSVWALECLLLATLTDLLFTTVELITDTALDLEGAAALFEALFKALFETLLATDNFGWALATFAVIREDICVFALETCSDSSKSMVGFSLESLLLFMASSLSAAAGALK